MSGLWMRATTAGHDEFRDIGVPKHFLRALRRSESGGLSDVGISSLVVHHSIYTFAQDRRERRRKLLSG